MGQICVYTQTVAPPNKYAVFQNNHFYSQSTQNVLNRKLSIAASHGSNRFTGMSIESVIFFIWTGSAMLNVLARSASETDMII